MQIVRSYIIAQSPGGLSHTVGALSGAGDEESTRRNGNQAPMTIATECVTESDKEMKNDPPQPK